MGSRNQESAHCPVSKAGPILGCDAAEHDHVPRITRIAAGRRKNNIPRAHLSFTGVVTSLRPDCTSSGVEDVLYVMEHRTYKARARDMQGVGVALFTNYNSRN